MMTPQSYYGGRGDFDPYHSDKSPHRAIPQTAYYERSTPYAYYEQAPRQPTLRSEYSGRPVTRAMIQEPEGEMQSSQARRRIAVACSRCRRRKIKCSGDPGDGSGCQACKTSGVDVSSCTFVRVGSKFISLGGVESYPQASSTIAAPLPDSSWSDNGYTDAFSKPEHHHHLYSRPSLPTLHTRSSIAQPLDYEAYEKAALDAYSYASATIPRQNSSANSYFGAENYPPWSTSNHSGLPVPAPATAPNYYGQHSAYTFGSLQAPLGPPGSTGRLPSVTADTFSSLNLGSLHSSLPTQTVQERRLPIPYITQYPQPTYAAVDGSEQRPLGSFTEPRVHIHGVHSRTAMPWSQDTGSSQSLRTTFVPITTQTPGLPIPVAQVTTSIVSEPVLGYQFNLNSNNVAARDSPNISPTSEPALSETFQSATSSTSSTSSMLPPSNNVRYPAGCSTQALPAITADGLQSRPSSSHNTKVGSLYSFSTDAGTRDDETFHRTNRWSGIDASADQSLLHQPQPQLATSAPGITGAPRRQSSFDQQRAATAQRMSLSNLNGHY